MGFVAQEVEDVLPEWVEDGEDGTKRLTVSGFEALAVAALRKLEARDRELDERIARLESPEAELTSLKASRVQRD